jgi:gluconokinase
VHGRDDVRIVFLDGTQDLIAARLAARKGHFMPPGLLASQLKTLERPGTNERPIVVSIDAPIEAIVDNIVSQLNLVPQ